MLGVFGYGVDIHAITFTMPNLISSVPSPTTQPEVEYPIWEAYKPDTEYIRSGKQEITIFI